MNQGSLKIFVSGLLFFFVQVIFLQHLTLFGAVADIVFVYSLWIMLHHQRHIALFIVFILAFFQDMALDYWGLNMISKVLFVYIGHKFIYSFKESSLLGGQVLLLLLATSAIYTAIYLGIGQFAGRFAIEGQFLVLWISGSFYTGLVGFIVYLLKSK